MGGRGKALRRPGEWRGTEVLRHPGDGGGGCGGAAVHGGQWGLRGWREGCGARGAVGLRGGAGLVGMRGLCGRWRGGGGRCGVECGEMGCYGICGAQGACGGGGRLQDPGLVVGGGGLWAMGGGRGAGLQAQRGGGAMGLCLRG